MKEFANRERKSNIIPCPPLGAEELWQLKLKTLQGNTKYKLGRWIEKNELIIKQQKPLRNNSSLSNLPVTNQLYFFQ